MISIHIGRLSLFSCLVALALAGFWPHISNWLYSTSLKHQDESEQNDNSKADLNKLPVSSDHPRFMGAKLNRITSKSQQSRTLGAYQILSNDADQSFKGFLAELGKTQKSQNQFSISSSILYLIMFGIAIVMMYSVISILNARVCKLSSSNFGSSIHEKANSEKRSIFRPAQKRISREERTRDIIKRHGGKNVAQAIRILAEEFEKQKEMFRCEADFD